MTREVVSPPKGVSRETFLNIVSATYTAWIAGGRGRLPSIKEIAVHSNCRESKIGAVLSSDEFKRVIRLRGINWTDDFTGITPEQSAAVAILTNPADRRDFGKKLKSAGISYHVYRAWMRQPYFKDYMEKVSEQMLQDNISTVHSALTNRALQGDVPAVKFFYELTGRYNPAQQEVVQVKAVLSQVLEIIQRRVTDPNVLNEIANDFTMLAVGSGSFGGTTYKPAASEELLKEIEVSYDDDPAPEFRLD